MTLYLAWFDAEADPRPALTQDEAYVALQPRLWLVDSSRSRSRLYHAIKHRLPPDTPLLVAALADSPKFKGMARGSLRWLRERANSEVD
jgi:hypothetical protein